MTPHSRRRHPTSSATELDGPRRSLVRIKRTWPLQWVVDLAAEHAVRGRAIQAWEYVTVLRRRRRLLALSIAACLVAAVVVSVVQSEVYVASAQVLLSAQQEALTPGTTLSDPNALQSQVATQAEVVVQSADVHERAVRTLGPAAGKVLSVLASGVDQTRVLLIKVEAKDGTTARDAANAYAAGYADYIRESALSNMSAIDLAFQKRTDQIQAQLSELDRKMAAPSMPASQVEGLRAQKDATAAQLAQFQQQYAQVQVDALTRAGGAATLLAQATMPTSPVSPRPVRNSLYGVGIGIFLGVALAFLAEQFDDRIRSARRRSSVGPSGARSGGHTAEETPP